MYACVAPNKRYLWKIFYNYAKSLSVLVVYVLISSMYLSHGYLLPLATCAGILVIDSVIYLMLKAKMLTDVSSGIFLITVCRYMLVFFGTNFWFLGHCVVFTILAANLVYKITRDSFGVEAENFK